MGTKSETPSGAPHDGTTGPAEPPSLTGSLARVVARVLLYRQAIDRDWGSDELGELVRDHFWGDLCVELDELELTWPELHLRLASRNAATIEAIEHDLAFDEDA